ncbi:MAG: restriction endonuclease, partial [Bacteroidetes bacterium]|nr:restriction endonuclease [Bacteroidota bacterium]
SLKENYTTYNQRLKNKDNQRQKKWEARKAEFLFKQEEKNKKIGKLFLSYKNCETEGITFFIDKIILKLELPVDIKVDWEVTTDTENKIVLIDFRLPNKEFIPKTKSVKYYVTKKEFSETFITEKEIDRIYDLFIIQLSLIVQNTIYTADSENAIDSIVFNGWVNTIEKATGHPKTFCIISLQTKKDELKKINLALVEPKACFKQLKGIAANKLSDLIPVAPILEINKEDKRFVESEGISKKLESENIAAMHWEKFEHLIRELFEKEFSSNGGEVKITQTSHDGGVDAIAFDPDPLKGGKIVIQAKRYTNVVSVSAVRDLYGTVMNEGANKGILVTTSNYGPDAYNFAKDKPLTLLNGSNLLHLMEKHGYSCRIDINEAKKILKNN